MLCNKAVYNGLSFKDYASFDSQPRTYSVPLSFFNSNGESVGWLFKVLFYAFYSSNHYVLLYPKYNFLFPYLSLKCLYIVLSLFI